MGLDIPQITRLMYMLEQRGVSVDKGIYTVEQAYEILKKELKVTN